MRRTLEQAAEVRAAAQAQVAADASGTSIRSLTDLDELRAATDLFDAIWGTSADDSHLTAETLRALVHAGNYASGAFMDGKLVGALSGFLGTDADGFYLHSHILGVSDASRGSNVGYALKQHQRAWALEAGLSKITWTFDPLVRRNAFFNLSKLGADAAVYFDNFYGAMDDEINAGDESDRILIEWNLDSDRVDLAASGRLDEPNVDEARATIVLSVSGEVSASSGATLLCATPDDIVAMRRDDPAKANLWRRALREALGGAMSDGYRVSGFTRAGWYVLERS